MNRGFLYDNFVHKIIKGENNLIKKWGITNLTIFTSFCLSKSSTIFLPKNPPIPLIQIIYMT